MIRIFLGVVMAFHGLAHLVGFVIPWHLIEPAGVTYKTTVLSGRVSVGDAGIRVIGLLWLLAALAFTVAAIGAVTNRDWWVTMAIGVSVASLLLSVITWPDSRIGVGVNVAILATLILGRALAWL